MKNKVRLLLSVLALNSQFLFLQTVQAQEIIELSHEDIALFGIEFAVLESASSDSGAKVPAVVINSPDSISNITSLYSGVLKKWLIQPGDSINAGEALAIISSESLLEVERQWVNASSIKEQAEFEFLKDESLFEQGIISQQRLMQTRSHFQQSSFELTVLEEKLVRAGFSADQLSDLRQGNSQLGDYYLRAPSAGVLTRRSLLVGEFVQENSKLGSLQASEQYWISAQVPARLRSSLELNQHLSVEETGEQLILRLKEAEVDQLNQTLKIQAEFLGSTNLLPGQLITIVLQSTENGVVIPSGAVVHSGNETVVYVRVTGGVEARNLRLMPLGSSYLAQSGISIEEELVVQGTSILKGMQLGLGGE